MLSSSASAQSAMDDFDRLSQPATGETSGMQDADTPSTFQASGGNEVLRHRDFAGKPCLAVDAFARAHAVDANLYDDVIEVVNSCPQRIAIQVCYYQSEDCIPMDIPGGERKEAILGILPSIRDFRFEFREKF
jgi:hypothetical protein